jgi:hypothetical protein
MINIYIYIFAFIIYIVYYSFLYEGILSCDVARGILKKISEFRSNSPRLGLNRIAWRDTPRTVERTMRKFNASSRENLVSKNIS